MKTLFFVLLAFSTIALADHDQDMHDTSHFGASYALTTAFYGVYHKGFDMPKLPAFLCSTLFTAVIGMSYEMTTRNSNNHVARAMLFNGMGIAGAGLAIKVFDF